MKRLSLLFVMGYMVLGVWLRRPRITCQRAATTPTPVRRRRLSTRRRRLYRRGWGIGLSHGGDTLSVRAGTYAESNHQCRTRRHSWSNKVRIANYNGETVWLKPPAGDSQVLLIQSFGGAPIGYIEFDGIN